MTVMSDALSVSTQYGEAKCMKQQRRKRRFIDIEIINTGSDHNMKERDKIVERRVFFDIRKRIIQSRTFLSSKSEVCSLEISDHMSMALDILL